MWHCTACKRFWHYELAHCAYCGGLLEKEEAKHLKVIGVTEVRVPSLEHPEVPYWVLLLEDEKGFRHLRKSMEERKIGDAFEVEKARKGLPSLGVVGTGNMAFGLALTGLKAGLQVKVKSRSLDSLAAFRSRMEVSLSKAMNEQDAKKCLERLALTADYKDLRDCDVIIENVVEKLQAKREVFADLEKACGGKVVLASNTSSLLVADMAKGLKHPERVVGLHFFNPVEKMRLVEIIPSQATSAEAVGKAREMAGALGKAAIEVKDSPGFLVNRVLFPFLNEAVLLLQEGTARAEDIDHAVKLGLNHPMGPLALIDLIGLDVFVEIMDNLKAETKDKKFEAAKLARQMLKEGKLGRKSKKGFYTY